MGRCLVDRHDIQGDELHDFFGGVYLELLPYRNCTVVLVLPMLFEYVRTIASPGATGGWAIDPVW
jgi:hypothetical protein